MKLMYKITGFLLLLVLLTAEDCGNRSSEVAAPPNQSVIYSNLQKDLESDKPDELVLSEFEKNGIQRLNDLVDYLNIYASKSYDVQFRKQAKQMIHESFISEGALLQVLNKMELQEDTSETLLLKTGNSISFEIGSIEVSRGFQPVQDAKYAGELQFDLIILPETDVDHNICSIAIFAVKSPKTFGNETLDVWKVYLGELHF